MNVYIEIDTEGFSGAQEDRVGKSMRKLKREFSQLAQEKPGCFHISITKKPNITGLERIAGYVREKEPGLYESFLDSIGRDTCIIALGSKCKDCPAKKYARTTGTRCYRMLGVFLVSGRAIDKCAKNSGTAPKSQ